MNVNLMKKLIAAMDSSNIPESFTDGKAIENETDIEALVTNWNDLKKAVAGQDGGQTEQEKAKADEAKADSDITAWSAKK